MANSRSTKKRALSGRDDRMQDAREEGEWRVLASGKEVLTAESGQGG